MNQLIASYAVVSASASPSLPLRDAVVVWALVLGSASLCAAASLLFKPRRSRRVDIPA